MSIQTETKNKIVLRKLRYKGAYRIGLFFLNIPSLNKLARQKGATWSSHLKCWHMPYDEQNYKVIITTFSEFEIVIQQQETLSSSEGLQGNQALTRGRPVLAANCKRVKPQPNVQIISPINQVELCSYSEILTLKGYSSSTQRTYKNEFSIFLQHLKNVSAKDIIPQRLSAYFFYCHKCLGLSENTIHSRLNALKFYYEQVLKREKFLWDIPRPKKHIILPKVISEEKIIEGLTGIENIKHKALLAIAYSAGLRVSEVVKLKVTDINSDRMQIFICRAKGKKDRVVTLSTFVLKILREYYVLYKPRIWLFEGQFKGECYSSRSAQQIFKATYKKLGLPAGLSFHSLRHSYATHLLENGTDIKYIQELLGHNDIKTTLRYTHVSKKAISAIESPLDKIARKLGL